MSVRQMALVFEHDWHSPAEQLIMLALADHAHDDGSEVRPSVSRVAWKVGASERTVRRHLAELRDRGILETTRDSTAQRPTVYRIDWSHATLKTAYSTPDKMTGVDPCHPVTPDTPVTPTPVTRDRPPLSPVTGKPSSTVLSNRPTEQAVGNIIGSTHTTTIKDSLENTTNGDPLVDQLVDQLATLTGLTATQTEAQRRAARNATTKHGTTAVELGLRHAIDATRAPDGITLRNPFAYAQSRYAELRNTPPARAAHPAPHTRAEKLDRDARNEERMSAERRQELTQQADELIRTRFGRRQA